MRSADYRALGAPGRPSKYRNKITFVDGIKFHSMREAKRYGELKQLLAVGEISDLQLQKPKFVFRLHGVRIGSYTPDFTYTEADRLVIEDCKGKRTQQYQLRKRLLRAFYGLEIRET